MQNNPKPPKKLFPQALECSWRANGFALVITLTLMVLLAVLAVGLLSLSGVVIRRSAVDRKQAEARANARLALMLAIGQLQESAGPDQRITTAADLLAAPGGDGTETDAAVGCRHWTGVYQSWDADTTDRPQPEFVSWLVSGPSDEAVIEDTARTADSQGIELVGTGTLGENEAGRVIVEPTLVDGSRLAWWIGDQGVKAAVSSPFTSDVTSPAESRAQFQAGRHRAVGLAETEGGLTPFSGLDNDDERRRRIASWQQSGFLADDDSQIFRGLFHDLAPAPSGMLVNVREGGFRKDLSMFLEREKDATPIDPLYTVAEKPGINFAELWLHYNLYKELESGRSLSFTTGGNSPSEAQFLEIKGTQAELLQDQASFIKQPGIVSYKTVLSFNSRTIGSGDDEKQRLAIVVDPLITYWNPLDVPVSMEPAYNSAKFWQLPYDLVLKIGDRTVRTSIRKALARTQYHYLTLIAGKVEPIVLKPGEVLVYSQAANTAISRYNPGLNFVNGKAGWNLGGGVAIDLRDENGDYIEADSTDTLTYEIEPNNEDSRGSRHWSLTAFSFFYKEDRAQRGESVGLGGSIIDSIYGEPYSSSSPKPAEYRLKATMAPHVYKGIDITQTRPLGFDQLRDRKEPFLLYAHNAKTEFGTDRGGRWLVRQNPKAIGHDFATLSEDELDLMPFDIQVEPLDSWRNRNLEVSPNGNGFFGGGMNAEFGTGTLITHGVPREPVHSLAAFQHAFANGFKANAPTSGYALINARAPMLPQISFAIGNSLAPSVLPPDETSGVDDGQRVIADHSYLANKALWDDWFLSGIAPRPASASVSERSQEELAREFLEGTTVLPVSRYRSAVPATETDEMIGRWFDGSAPSEEAHLLTAAALRVDGLFNVNSTSVEAWKAMLGSLRGQSTVTQAGSGGQQLTPADANLTPVAHLITSQDLVAEGDGVVAVQEPSQWVGRRTLDDDEIGALARAVVSEVRKRGPFLSLADFVNRRVGEDAELAKAGAIQSALDSPEAGVNTAYEEGDRAVSEQVADRFPFPDAEKGAAAYGAPGIVKQADILTPIAPYLSVRSDSFIIRAYGESVAGGEVVARAWCEARVERHPQFVDPGDEPTDTANELESPVNLSFGRRFVVTSFRWLNPDEI